LIALLFDAGQTPGSISNRFTITVWIYSDTMPDGSVVSRMVDEAKGEATGSFESRQSARINLTSVWESDAIRLETEEAYDTRVLAPSCCYLQWISHGQRVSKSLLMARPPGRGEMDNLYRRFATPAVIKDPLRVGGGWGQAPISRAD
jgi:hypothetical protein